MTAATAGPQGGGTFNSVGGNPNSWVNASNAGADDNSYATNVAPGISFGSTDPNNWPYLNITNFGFSLPATTTSISGITVRMKRHRSGGSSGEVRSNTIQLIKGGTASGDNKADTGTNWPTSETEVTYGSTSDVWGLSLAYTDINDSGFGISIRCVGTSNGTNRTANIDYVSVQVDYVYTAGGGPSPATAALFWAFP